MKKKRAETDDLREIAREICLREKSLGRQINITEATRAVRHFLDIVAENPETVGRIFLILWERRTKAEEAGRK